MGRILCFVTCKDADEARKIADSLLKKRLAGCTQIIANVESHYWWKGKLEKGNEALLILKTRKELRKSVEDIIKKLHSYELPVMDFFDTELNKEAEKWLDEETKA